MFVGPTIAQLYCHGKIYKAIHFGWEQHPLNVIYDEKLLRELVPWLVCRTVGNPWPHQHCLQFASLKPGLYFSRRQSLTVARLGDRPRQSRACLYFSWRLSPAQVGDCCQQSPTVVFQVQQCWTFNAVASSRWHFPSNQQATTAFIRSRSMQTWRTWVVIKHLKLQLCVCHCRPDCKSHRK